MLDFKLKKYFFILIPTVSYFSHSIAQDKEWIQFSDSTKYFPLQKIDPILIFSSNRSIEHITDPAISDDSYLLKTEIVTPSHMIN